jgi:ribosomal protein S18 acetylase RimI-like enzyme
VRIERATAADDELRDALARLLPQLSPRASVPTTTELTELVGSPATYLLVARDEAEHIVGVATLLVQRTPAGLHGVIEDVVVDEHARGHGAGESLTREAQRLAADAGVSHVLLTSRPAREAANRLYRRLGFEPYETNVYVWRPDTREHGSS